MKMITLIATVLACFAAGAADKPLTNDKEAMMKKWKEFATPGEQHKKLGELAGDWKYTSKMWETPEGKAEESKGTTKFKMIMGGRYLQQELKGKAMGMPFEGMGFLAYDNVTKKYESIWLDNMGTGVTRAVGDMDTATNTLKDSGKMSCPMTPGGTRDFRSEWKIVDKNNMVFSMYGPPPGGGAEYRWMEMTYKR